LLAGSTVLFNCGQPTSSENSQKVSELIQTAAPIFQLSTAPIPDPAFPKTNWCTAKFGANLLVNAEKLNTNRRYFYLLPGVTKLNIGPSNSSATLLLKPMPNGNVDVFTGNNFPECLSHPKNLSPAGGSASMRYYNRTNIDFRIDLQEEGTRPKVTVEFGPGTNYGMSVNHCPECQ
jgi:hypothetical protein